MKRFFHAGLNGFRHFSQYICGLMHPIVLLKRGRPVLGYRAPKAQSTIGNRQFGSAIVMPCDVSCDSTSSQLASDSRYPSTTVPVFPCGLFRQRQSWPKTKLVIHPYLTVNTISPDIDIPSFTQVSFSPLVVFGFPLLLEPRTLFADTLCLACPGEIPGPLHIPC
jgi:hypothetical protein